MHYDDYMAATFVAGRVQQPVEAGFKINPSGLSLDHRFENQASGPLACRICGKRLAQHLAAAFRQQEFDAAIRAAFPEGVLAIGRAAFPFGCQRGPAWQWSPEWLLHSLQAAAVELRRAVAAGDIEAAVAAANWRMAEYYLS